ncbi:efflux RND transporter periplasmic adaptor subunit [Sporosarcina soli]|uniref:Efflux RND transporter periplasmic adaptor subunit n=1 Tax=Sporosarcina soli TaxID=334736 RepID=A0ABW0TL73_9BACL
MNKRMNIAVAIAISSFIAMNFYLLFSDKSVIPKSVYIDRYEQMGAHHVQQEIGKEGLVAPFETYTVYVGREETVDTWFVQEGDHVDVGDNLAFLQTEHVEGQRAIWEADLQALDEQESALLSLISNLESERKYSANDSSANVSEKVEGEWAVDVQVDVKQDASFAQAISAAEQELALIERQRVVVEAQLAQNTTKPALVSPVEGIVSNITRHGTMLAVDIFSSQRIVVTYAKNKEWQQIENGDRVLIQGDGVEEVLEGTVLSVSMAPASDNEWLRTYKALDDETITNPLAYYEVRILFDSDLESIPFGTDVNAVVIVNEAQDAITINDKWLHRSYKESASVWKIDDTGHAQLTTIETPFSWQSRAVVSEGLQIGDIALDKPDLSQYGDAPRVFMALPTDMPTKSQWRTFGWRNYIKYGLIK